MKAAEAPPGAGPPPVSPPPKPAGPTATINCLCGQALKIFPTDNEKVIHCAKCERAIQIALIHDPTTGAMEVMPLFPEDPGQGLAPATSDVHDPPSGAQARVEELPPELGAPASPIDAPPGSLGVTPLLQFAAAEEAIPVLPKAPPPPEPEPPPAPPAALHFLCTCGRGLVAKRDVYGKQLKCHRCGTWLGIDLSYDAQKKVWQIIPGQSSEPLAPDDPPASSA